MSEGMLVGKRETIGTNFHCAKYFTILMESCKRMLKFGKCIVSDYTVTPKTLSITNPNGSA